MPSPRIALVHAMPVAIDPVATVFRELWPQAQTTNLLEDSLAPDLAAAGSITPAIVDRIVALAQYGERCGANAVLFTCSAFGTAIEAAKQAVKVPVLKPNEAMIEDAIAAGSNLALLTTFEPSIPSLKRELQELATDRGIQLKLKTRTVPAAITALLQGQGDIHDRLIHAAAAEMGPCDALVLGQFSMARAATGIPAAAGRKILTSPHSAVARLKQILDA
ncbi:MAG TPA: aspartate/glutamate racemase family protein [Burkholderiales bacterium]|nr:aspartate/glutamate racemase family protein [Burkholderiales bacterium]